VGEGRESERDIFGSVRESVEPEKGMREWR